MQGEISVPKRVACLGVLLRVCGRVAYKFSSHVVDLIRPTASCFHLLLTRWWWLISYNPVIVILYSCTFYSRLNIYYLFFLHLINLSVLLYSRIFSFTFLFILKTFIFTRFLTLVYYCISSNNNRNIDESFDWLIKRGK